MQSLIPGFSGELKTLPARTTAKPCVRKLRPSQEAVFQDLKGLGHLILNSPTGWGKTTTLIFLAHWRLLTVPGAKIIITVPQRIIGGGFSRRQSVEMPDGTLCEWGPLDLCERNAAKVVRLIKWLSIPGEELDRRVVVTTHASLVAAMARIKNAASLPTSLTVIIDESHHLQAGDTGLEGFNQLGSAIDQLIDLGVSVWLATAFFFRGDKLPILGQRQLARFKRIFIPFDVHFGEMMHLKSYAYDFVVYRQSVFPDLEALLSRPQVPTLIYCPPEGHAVLQGKSKTDFVRQVVSLLQRSFTGSQVWSPGLSGSARNVIVDLVDLTDRERKVKYINAHGDRISTILTVGMMQEGADWPSCARIIDLVPSTSDQTRNQKFGRLIRDYPGKEHIHYYSLLPFVLNKGEDKQRETLSQIFAHLHASLILENALKPIKMPVRRGLAGENTSSADDCDDHGEIIDLLGLFDEPRQRQIEEEVSKELVNLAATLPGPWSWQTAGPTIEAVLTRLGCAEIVGSENVEGLRDQIVLIWRRRKQPDLAVEDLIGAGFDRIWATDALDPIKVFSAGICGTATFEDLRKVVGSNGQQEAESWARECAARYRPGELPNGHSRGCRGRYDGGRIVDLRMAKKGVKGTWYPTVEAIFEEAGHHRVFDTIDYQAEAEAWARECATRYQPGHLPGTRATELVARGDAKRISHLRAAKQGKGRNRWYPTVERIFKEAGHVGVFECPDREAEVYEWARECARRYKPGQLPRYNALDPKEKADWHKLNNLKNAKKGKNRGRWYPLVETIFEQGGHVSVFG
jgi:hypothetical protein